MRRRFIPRCSLTAAFNRKRCLSLSYPVLAKLSLGYPSPWGRLPTCYSPVRLSKYCYFPIDLHVLGTPPAFILSQDQTLNFYFFLVWFGSFSWPFSGFSLIDVVSFCFFRFFCSVFKDQSLPRSLLATASLSYPTPFPFVNIFFYFFLFFFCFFTIVLLKVEKASNKAIFIYKRGKRMKSQKSLMYSKEREEKKKKWLLQKKKSS